MKTLALFTLLASASDATTVVLPASTDLKPAMS